MNKTTAPQPVDYPWYAADEWEDLQQGDLLFSCPVIIPTEDLTEVLLNISTDTETANPVAVKFYDLIIMSQSCDLAQSNIEQVLLCGIFPETDLGGKEKREEVRKERRPAFHMIESCDLEGFKRGRHVVDFRTLHTLPKEFVTAFAKQAGSRVRLLPPYREHLSQAFARYFMRVGLPRPLR